MILVAAEIRERPDIPAPNSAAIFAVHSQADEIAIARPHFRVPKSDFQDLDLISSHRTSNKGCRVVSNFHLGLSADANHIDMARARQLPARPTRWAPRRKLEVVTALRDGLLSLEEACEHYALSVEECLTWQREFELFGLAGLQVTKTQKHRRQKSQFEPLARREGCGAVT